MPASEIRALALTRVRPLGQQPGYGGRPGDAVRLGRDQDTERRREQPASSRRRRRPASTQHEERRGCAIVAPIAQRRPWLNRSRNGPISGATIANGSIVSPRNSATWPRASPRRDLEEQGAGQRDRHRGVAGGVERVQLDQPGEPGLAGALGVRRRGGPDAERAAGRPGRCRARPTCDGPAPGRRPAPRRCRAPGRPWAAVDGSAAGGSGQSARASSTPILPYGGPT